MYASSASNYATSSAAPTIVYGQHRDLAFAQLHAKTAPAAAAEAEHAPLVVVPGATKSS